ncbi:MAG: serine hydrolase domain-containing protein [Myxococcota bacterium]
MIRLPSCAGALLALVMLGCADGGDSRGLADGTPADVGMDAAVLAGARTYAFTEERHTQAVVVVRDGAVVAEWYAEDRDQDSLATSWSIAKSFTSALIGIALERGEIPSVDTPMHTWFPEFLGTDKEASTLRDVLEMASGIAWIESSEADDAGDSDIAEMALTDGESHVDIVLDNEVAHPPGTFFNYSSGDTMMLSHVLQQSTGMRTDQYAQRFLFDRIGIDEVRWWRDRSGHTLTYCCADLEARDFAHFGQLFLDRGVYDGRQVVSESWVAESIAPSRSNDEYGLQWWLPGNWDDRLPPDTYAAIGVDGQYIYIIPSLDLVVVRLGRYYPTFEPDGVVTTSLFSVIPNDGILPERGTQAPETWDDYDFLAPVIDSIQD